MPIFSVTGSVDPLLTVHLDAKETIFAERNAMVAMNGNLELSGQARGGVLSALGRKIFNDESFFQQKITASGGAGDVDLAPTLPGGIAVIETGERHYLLTDGSYLASEDGVEFEMKTQSIGRALFGDSGGFFVMQTKGKGKVAVSGLGSVREIVLDGKNDYYVDNGHVVAWDASLTSSVALNTGKKGFFGKILHSQTSGEGVILKFSGTGSLYISSRNKGGFIDWIFSNMPEDKLPENK